MGGREQKAVAAATKSRTTEVVVDSVPSGLPVRYGNDDLGTTPLRIPRAKIPAGFVRVVMPMDRYRDVLASTPHLCKLGTVLRDAMLIESSDVFELNRSARPETVFVGDSYGSVSDSKLKRVEVFLNCEQPDVDRVLRLFVPRGVPLHWFPCQPPPGARYDFDAGQWEKVAKEFGLQEEEKQER